MTVNQYRTMAEAISGLRQRGFTADFEIVENFLRSPVNGHTFKPEDVKVVEHHRFEGETNPDDMSVVYAIESRDGDRGIIVDAYGTYASPAVGELLSQARRQKDMRH